VRWSHLYPYCRCSCHCHRSCHCLGVLSTIYGIKPSSPIGPIVWGINVCIYISRFHPCPPVPFSFVFSMTRWLIVSHCFELPNCEIAWNRDTSHDSFHLPSCVSSRGTRNLANGHSAHRSPVGWVGGEMYGKPKRFPPLKLEGSWKCSLQLPIPTKITQRRTGMHHP